MQGFWMLALVTPGFDLVFCRDVLSHVPDLDAALMDSYRVTAGGGRMVVYQTFGTDRLEPGEAARICADLAVAQVSFDRERFERGAKNAGFDIETVAVSDRNGVKHGKRTARTERPANYCKLRDLYVRKTNCNFVWERSPTRVERADALWVFYQMIGKLEPRVYTLKRNASLEF